MGVSLAPVTNPTNEPDEWSVSISRLSDSSTVLPVSAFAVIDAHLDPHRIGRAIGGELTGHRLLVGGEISPLWDVQNTEYSPRGYLI